MSLPNWTPRLLPGSARGADAPAASPDAGAATVAREVPALGATVSLVGSRIGPYHITKRLGAGGVGEVYKATDTLLKREVAIKMLRDELAADPVFLERFRREAQLHAQLSHPNVASVHAFAEEGGKPFIVMEFVAGVSLDEFVRAGGPVPVERALGIFRRALDGIAHAHSRGIVHRDIKPANIMLADNGQVKVMDFGIAKALDTTDHLTRIGHVAGTAKAMSPEQIRGKQADVRSDIYSLGIVLYTLLAGRPPFHRGSDLELMKAQLEQAPPPLRALVRDLPANVEALVMRALEKDPQARFQTVGDFARAVDACNLGSAAKPLAADAQADATGSRTMINPALQGVDRLAAAPSKPKARPGSPQAAPAVPAAPVAADAAALRWARTGATALGVLVLLGGGALLWSQVAPDGTAASAPPPIADAAGPPPGAPTSPAAQAAPSPTSPTEVAAAHTAPAPPPVQPDAATAPTAAPAPLSGTPAAPKAAQPGPLAATVAATAAATVPTTVAAAAPLPAPNAEPAATLIIARLGATQPADAAQGFRPGERVRLLVTLSRDAHVYCYLQDETRRIERFYPNRFQTASLVRATEPLEIPGNMRFELVANSLKATETVACFASERDLAAQLPAAVFGSDFTRLGAASLDEVRQAFERVASGPVAEGRFRIDVR